MDNFIVIAILAHLFRHKRGTLLKFRTKWLLIYHKITFGKWESFGRFIFPDFSSFFTNFATDKCKKSKNISKSTARQGKRLDANSKLYDEGQPQLELVSNINLCLPNFLAIAPKWRSYQRTQPFSFDRTKHTNIV